MYKKKRKDKRKVGDKTLENAFTQEADKAEEPARGRGQAARAGGGRKVKIWRARRRISQRGAADGWEQVLQKQVSWLEIQPVYLIINKSVMAGRSGSHL